MLLISSHDYADNPTFEPLNPDTHPTEAPMLALSEAITRYVPRYIPSWLKPTVNDVAKENDKPNKTSIALGLNSLRQFLDLSIKSGAKIYIFQHWTQDEITQGKASEGNFMINQVCVEKKVNCIQMNGFFENYIKKGENPFRDNIHPNDTGQKIIAKSIWQELFPKCNN